MRKVKTGILDKIKEKEYNKEYVKFCAVADLEKIEGKSIYIIYDDILPDLFVSIDTDNRFARAIDYDIYADRLKEVTLKFPNGEVVSAKIDKVDIEKKDDGVFTLTWQVPKITIEWHGLDIDISIIDLIERDVQVLVKDYEF